MMTDNFSKKMAVGLIVLCICCNNKTNRFIEISGKIHDSIRLQNGKYVYLFDAAEKGVIKDSVQKKTLMKRLFLSKLKFAIGILHGTNNYSNIQTKIAF
jgi:hypothetical protein